MQRVRADKITFSPEFELREAARFGHYKFDEFMRLTPFERASAVAHYRTRGRIDAAKDSKHASRTPSSRSRIH